MNKSLAVELAASLIRRFEGFYSDPYICPAGKATIGFGATFYEDGRKVALSDAPISRERAEALLSWHIEYVFMPAVMKLCPAIDTPERLAAITDFTFNLGTGNLSASTLRKRINANRWEDVPIELSKWNKAGGKVLNGLTKRREAEIDLI